MFFKLALCLIIAIIFIAIHFHLKSIQNSVSNSPLPRSRERFSSSIKIDLADVEVRGMNRSIKVKTQPKSRVQHFMKSAKDKKPNNKISLSYFTVNYEDEEGRPLTFESPMISMKQSNLRTQLNHQKETVVHFDQQNPRKFAMDLQFLGMVN